MNDNNSDDETLDQHGNPIPTVDPSVADPLKRVDRYRIERSLGKGGFGQVYLAYDEQLNRQVAVKVPHARLITKPGDVEAYLTEARTVASLDHPGIVPVHDVGSTQECPCYIVSKYIDGTDLSARTRQQQLNYREAAELTSTVARALHYAHKQGLVHRDIKPGNILVGKDGQPFVVDFGLALREENIGKGPNYAGTPAYMSPEQARGEGHRVDGRSDIFSLGVVLYQLLSGRRPFQADTEAELLEQVTSCEEKPLRQFDEKLPKELVRICHKAMAKRASDRYSSAHDMAEDLEAFLSNDEAVSDTVSSYRSAVDASVNGDTQGTEANTAVTGSSTAGTSDTGRIKIVPKGLRSFDSHDADFFLELLPGPRDRNGLPDSLRFWKTQIEETDADTTFLVGLIYGPSGCGKSSLVKAGLLPCLSADVISVYIEATPEETETRLLRGLRKRFTALDVNASLKETLAALRRGQGIPVGKKVLIVLDQFEQWLHANNEAVNTELVQALRQCDGEHVQCLLMVRDDFWLAVSRFLRELEVRLLEGHNVALADLFDPEHARRVLAAFGRAFGRLPERIRNTTPEQTEFLNESVAGLTIEGKVICVRLALFAEMMKNKPWTPASLREVGGTAGVGVTFLEETFSSSSASPEHRFHQKPARAVLNDLLPDSGSDIKGSMRSYAELLESSGYGNRPQDFGDLIRILDSELRLITPTDPEGAEYHEDTAGHTETGQKYFQLTHDYTVRSLRDWLTRKQKETRRGRAELRLFDRSVGWNAQPENRFLPSWWEYMNIRLFTDRKKWTEPQRRTMAAASQFHGIWSAVVAVLLVALVIGGMTVRNRIERRQRDVESTQLVEGLLKANTSEVAGIIEKLKDFRASSGEHLKNAFAESPKASNARLHAALAILAEDKAVLPFLKERLLTVSAVQFDPVRDLMEDDKTDLTDDYWQIANDNQQKAARRFQAACTLATYAPGDKRWESPEFGEFMAGYLVGVLPSELLPWRNALRPVKEHLIAPLSAVYRDENLGEQVRSFATDTLADYLSDDPKQLFDLLADSNLSQFGTVFERLSSHVKIGVELANAEVTKATATDAREDVKEIMAIRKANSAVFLLQMGAADHVWPLLKHSPDPRTRSYIVHWLSARDGDPNVIIERFGVETDVTIKRALLLCLGEFDESRFPRAQRAPLLETLLAVYRNSPDPGLHAAAEWCLRKWGHGKELSAIDMELRQSEEQLTAAGDNDRRWYVNGQGQTYAILDAGEFQMGSPQSESGHESDERLHRRRIGRRFAISTKEVTRAQWRVFAKAEKDTWQADPDQLKPFIHTDDSPMLAMTWYEAAWYCNWLSKQEKIPENQWCYKTNEQGKYAAGMKAKDDFWELTGYRLATEAEWEFACRAGTTTSRYFGQTETLLPEYARYLSNGDGHSWPGASLKPNDFGLFDMQGNAFEWCYNTIGRYSTNGDKAIADAPASDTVSDSVSRALRGGSFNYLPAIVRSSDRYAYPAGSRNNRFGFRTLRTYHTFE